MRIIQESIPSDAVANNQSNTGNSKKIVQKNNVGSYNPPSKQGTEKSNEDKGKKKATGNDESPSENDFGSENVRRTKDKGKTKVGRNNEDSSTDHDSDEEVEPPLVGKEKKKVRGPTRLDILPVGETKRKSLEWNDLGQAVGKESIRFSSTIGVFARQYIPITIDGWKNVDGNLKDELWTLILVRYFSTSISEYDILLLSRCRLLYLFLNMST